MASKEHPKDYGIGMRIAEYRRALGWSQHQLAKRLKTNSHTVENWEQAAAIPCRVPSSIMRKFIYKSGRTQSAQGREPALDCPIAEGRERVKGGEAACEALDVSSVFCYQPAMSSCISR